MAEQKLNSIIKLDYSGYFSSQEIQAILGLVYPSTGLSYKKKRLFIANRLGFNGTKLAYARQIHSNRILIVDEPGLSGDCDGLITDEFGIVLSIQVADCVPIFMYSPDVNVIGLVHAGWRGIAHGIVKNAVDKMIRYFNAKPNLIEVFQGPSIQPCCYEVGENVIKYFKSNFYNIVDSRKYNLDLQKTCKKQLEKCGVKTQNIVADHRCTCCSDLGFHSYRRDGADAGRNICFMGLV